MSKAKTVDLFGKYCHGLALIWGHSNYLLSEHKKQEQHQKGEIRIVLTEPYFSFKDQKEVSFFLGVFLSLSIPSASIRSSSSSKVKLSFLDIFAVQHRKRFIVGRILVTKREKKKTLHGFTGFFLRVWRCRCRWKSLSRLGLIWKQIVEWIHQGTIKTWKNKQVLFYSFCTPYSQTTSVLKTMIKCQH